MENVGSKRNISIGILPGTDRNPLLVTNWATKMLLFILRVHQVWNQNPQTGKIVVLAVSKIVSCTNTKQLPHINFYALSSSINVQALFWIK